MLSKKQARAFFLGGPAYPVDAYERSCRIHQFKKTDPDTGLLFCRGSSRARHPSFKGIVYEGCSLYPAWNPHNPPPSPREIHHPNHSGRPVDFLVRFFP